MNFISFLVCGTPSNFRESMERLKTSSQEAKGMGNFFSTKLIEAKAWKNIQQKCSKISSLSFRVALVSPCIYLLVNKVILVASITLLALAFMYLAKKRSNEAGRNVLIFNLYSLPEHQPSDVKKDNAELIDISAEITDIAKNNAKKNTGSKKEEWQNLAQEAQELEEKFVTNDHPVLGFGGQIDSNIVNNGIH